ncbi:MAG: alpha/beta fold hydrolase, partial [Marmoricola sp.]
VVVTVGQLSPPVRHQAADALEAHLGYPVREVPGASHFAPHDAPEQFAASLAAVLESGIAEE